jgi:hypothetical protein
MEVIMKPKLKLKYVTVSKEHTHLYAFPAYVVATISLDDPESRKAYFNSRLKSDTKACIIQIGIRRS